MAVSRYHVFLSYNEQHRPAVEELARWLVREGLTPFFDWWGLIPGEPEQEALERALIASASCAVVLGAGEDGIGPWQEVELRAAIDRQVRQRAGGFRVIPVLLPGAEWLEDRLPACLKRYGRVAFDRMLDDAEALHRLACGIRGEPPGPKPGAAIVPGVEPYRGLRMFEEEHESLFFGRERLTREFVELLREPTVSGLGERLLAVLGPSGSGKSSVVRAGLVPALRRGALEGSASWPVAIVKPGAQPLESLAISLETLGRKESPPISVYDRVALQQDGARSLHVAARLLLGEPPRTARLLVVVDQFEEIFTLCTSDALRTGLIDNLLGAVAEPGGPVVVVLAMRADFYGHCAGYRGLADLMARRQKLVGAMNPEELRWAIEKPAQRCGGTLDPGLVELLLRDALGGVDPRPRSERAGEDSTADAATASAQPGHLPLLQFALGELWRRNAGGRLTIAAYRDVGGLVGALERHADTVLAQLARDDPANEMICRRIFLSLVHPGQGTVDTRRSAAYQVLASNTGAEKVVRTLIDARLLTADDTKQSTATVDLAHEALIPNWPELRKWIAAERDDLLTRDRLAGDAREWATKCACHPGYLYDGARLALALEWADKYPDEASHADHVTEFLASSRMAEKERQDDELARAYRLSEAERKRAEEAEARKREAEVSAERQRQLSRRFLVAAFVAIGLAVIAVGLTLLATAMQHKAEEQAAIAELSLAKGIEDAGKKQHHYLSALDWLLKSKKRDVSLPDGGGSQFDLRNGCGNLIAAWVPSQESYVGHTTDEQDPKGNPVVGVWFDSTQKGFFSLARNGELLHFSKDGTMPTIRHLPAPKGSSQVTASAVVALAGEHSILLTGHKNGSIWAWDTKKWEDTQDRRLEMLNPRYVGRIDHPEADDDPIKSIVCTPNGSRCITLSSNAYLAFSISITEAGKKWNVENGVVHRLELAQKQKAVGAAISRDGNTLAVTTQANDGSVYLWKWDEKERAFSGDRRRLKIPGVICCLCFDSNARLVAGSTNGKIHVWDTLHDEQVGRPLSRHVDGVQCVVASENGEWIASGGKNWRLNLWKVGKESRVKAGEEAAENKPEDEWYVHDGTVVCLGISRDGKTTIAGCRNGFSGWRERSDPRLVEEKDQIGIAIAIASDGTALVKMADGKPGVVVPSAGTPTRLPGSHGEPACAAFSADASRVLVGHSSRVAVLYQKDQVVWGKSRVPQFDHGGLISAVCLNLEANWAATGGEDGRVRLWSTENGKPLGEGLVHSDPGGAIRGMAFHPERNLLAVAGMGGTDLWGMANPKRPTLVKRLKEVQDRKGATAVAFSPNGQWLITGGGDWLVRLFDVDECLCNNKPQPKLDYSHSGSVTAVAFGPDHTTVVSGSMDETARWWDLATNHALGPEFKHGGDVRVVAIVWKDNQPFLRTGSDDRAFRTWKLPVLRSADEDFERLKLRVEIDTARQQVTDGRRLQWLRHVEYSQKVESYRNSLK